MAVRLRPRNPSEALDLGFALVRENAAATYGAWLAIYLPVAAVAYAVLWGHPFIAWFVLWWLKPVFDRILLALLSRTLFGEPATAASVLRSPRQWLFGTGAFAALTWRRFDLSRSFHLPVRQLERLRGKPGRQRVKLLDRDMRAAATGLTVLLVLMELFVMVSAAFAITLLAPVRMPMEDILEVLFTQGLETAGDGALVGAVLATLATALVEPVYVAAGFTLYLQRRTMLEGWDIELRFRTLADRLAAPAASLAGVFAAVMLALVLLPASMPTRAAGKDPATEIKAVMAAPDFGKTEMKRRLEYVGPTWESKDDKPSTKTEWKWLEKIALFFSELARFATWIVGGTVLAAVLYFLARYLRFHGRASGARDRPDFLFGLDVRPDSLPEDVAAAATTLVREGRTREALSLLYRGALVRFLDRGLEFLRGDTEGDCVRKVDVAEPEPTRAFFRRLVSAWQSIAYGHRSVGADAVLALAGEWHRQFAPAADAQEAR
ncbi:hypothetical protein BWI17_07270 [Betaproteobacteria bacterium GR16-43]|nr:hypothetical protein BWI17_07270 [Betaproteobacteria bacterium GR16-43]